MPSSSSSAQASAPSASSPRASAWRQALLHEAHDLAAALAGGAIVGVPLLFTMEMWWHGADLSPQHLLLLLGVGLALNWAFDLFSGFREEFSPLEALREAITGIAIGVVLSLTVLCLIGELSADSWRGKAGKVLISALAVSVGVSFANSQVRKQSRTEEESEEGEEDEEGADEKSVEKRRAAQLKADLRSVGSSAAGATVFALNVAPTEEIMLIAARLSPLQQLVLLGFEAILGYIIVFASGFVGEGGEGGRASQPLWETLLATALSLGVAAALTALVGQRSAVESLPLFVSATVTLGLPAVVGGAAGRIIA